MMIRHDTDPLLYLADSKHFPAVVQIKSYQEGEVLERDAMGMLIHPEWILTAAHCADETTPFPNSIQIADQQYAVKQRVLHPHWQNAEVIKEVSNDIALVQLAQSAQNISPLKLYLDSDEAGQTATFVGWGSFGNGLIGVENADGKFRIATNQIEKTDEQWLVFRFDEPPSATNLEGISGPGDSGGPALIRTEASWLLVGISSTQCSNEEYKQQENWQEGKEGIYGVWEYYTRVSQYADWIYATISEL